MKVTREQVIAVAKLARLELSESEVERLSKDLTSIIEYVKTLDELKTQAVEPTFHTIPISNVLREDTVRPSWKTEALLGGAPEHDSRAIKVPKIIEAF